MAHGPPCCGRAAKLINQRVLTLIARPGMPPMQTVQLLLGHNSIQTTIRAYCGLEQGDAIKRYDAYRKLCLSEIKLGRTGGEVHRGMAWVRSGRRRERDAETEHPC